jgi:hypothetical protein
MPIERNIVNDEVVEAINAKPAWLLRNGLLLVFCIITLVLAGALFITYPEVLSVPAKLAHARQDFIFELPASDRLHSVLAVEGKSVQANQPIANIIRPNNASGALIRSPFAGRFHTTTNFETGQPVLMVVPEGTSDLKILARVSEAQVRRIKKGQPVHIKLAGFPYREYGYLEGNVMDIPEVSVDDHYTVSIQLQDGNRTNTGHTIPFNNQLPGTCEIEIERVSIFKRLFRQLFRF